MHDDRRARLPRAWRDQARASGTAPRSCAIPAVSWQEDEDAVGIGADREERGVAEIEQAGEADHDIEPERQDRERAGVGRRVDIAVVACRCSGKHAARTSPRRSGRGAVRCCDRARGTRAAISRTEAAAAAERSCIDSRLTTCWARRARSRPAGRNTSTSTRIEKMITSVQRRR